MTTETLEHEEAKFEVAIVSGLPSKTNYDFLEQAGFDTSHFYVDDSGNDYWDLTIYFCKLGEREIAMKWVEVQVAC
tara:strand:- start:1220 stop:1447 length:228 start_codon:yes stop_codon:yes gene_type:complete